MTKREYKVHRFDPRTTKDQDRTELFLNSLEGEVVAIIPNVTLTFRPMGATADAQISSSLRCLRAQS